MRTSSILFGLLLASVCAPGAIFAQNAQGGLTITARITPSGARPEPMRQFTFYILTKSYENIRKDVEADNPLPIREKFIDGLKVSPELKEWLKAHEVFDLTAPELDKLVTPADIIHVPEFLLAYQRSNSGGVTSGIPKPRYVDADKTDHPERYEKMHTEYLTALKKFIQGRPETVSGMELELTGVNPQSKWARIDADHKKLIGHVTPELAQTKYLAGKMETDLDGRASIADLPAGNYWISTLDLEANAGDIRLRWDVPITIQAGQVARIELTNLNAADNHRPTP
ncbi:MAG TPA: hypothetical protein VGI16_04060 [Candidatus Acidoferrum sp.]|jgi:hypothetical protein